MHKLFFWNAFHNGDVMFTRPLVKAVRAQHDVAIAWGCFYNHKYLLDDLSVTIFTDPRDDRLPRDLSYLCPPEYTPINTWVGQYAESRRCIWTSVVATYNRQVTERGLPHLAISEGIVPMLDFPDLEMDVSPPAIYAANGAVRSGQSTLALDMARLAREFPGLNFYCTAAPPQPAPNLIDCSHLNLVELSAVSNRCLAMIGRPGGAFDCTFSEPNRFKPRAIMGLKDPLNPTIWEYPGLVAHYLHSHEKLQSFLQTLPPQAPPDAPPARPATRLPKPPQELLARVTAAVVEVLHTPQETPAMRMLLDARHHVARVWASLEPGTMADAFRDQIGRVYQVLLNFRSGAIMSTPEERVPLAFSLQDPRPDECQWARDLVAAPDFDPGQPGALPRLMAAMLYLDASELPLWPDLRKIPPWFRWHYLDAVFRPPCWSRPGEADQVARLWEYWISHIAEGLERNPLDAQWREAALCFLQRANLSQLPASTQNLTTLARHRARILEHALASSGTSLDHDFAPPTGPDSQIRVGLLVQHLAAQPATTTRSNLAGEHLLYNIDRGPLAFRREGAVRTLCQQLGPRRFAVTLYCLQSIPQPARQELLPGIPRLVGLPGSLPAQVTLIRQDDLDILLFGSSVSEVANQAALLATHRLARQQGTLHAEGLTTGMRHMDFAISGHRVETAASENEYTERLLTLPGPGALRGIPSPLRERPARPITRASLQLPAEDPIFVSFANYIALTPDMLATWLAILTQLPRARLLTYPFHVAEYHAYPAGIYHHHLQKLLARHDDSTLAERVMTLNPDLTRGELQACLELADVYLDAYPASDFDHPLDALSLGIPVVTRTGPRPRSRRCSAVLEELGLPELVANDNDQYIATAVRLGSDPAHRKQLAARIRSGMQSPVCFLDPAAYAQALAGVLEQLAASPQKSRPRV